MAENQFTSRNDRVIQVIAEYLQAAERGESPDRKLLLGKYPDIAEELESFFDNEAQFKQFTVYGDAESISVGSQTSNPSEPTEYDATVRCHGIGDANDGEINAVLRPEIPAVIGRYRIERILGKGGFGLVYLAYDDTLSRRVAIKLPHDRLVSRPEDAEAYLTEARTVANLDHSHIVPVYDVGSTQDCPVFIVSKYIDGADLASQLRKSRLNLHAAVQLVAAVAEALHYAHKQGLVHRDVKPGNILLDKSGKGYVADFGLALREENTGKGPRYAGTPAYMSPEQARGEGHRVDGRSDIFSLGVVFYELLTGGRPFKGDTEQELLEQITNVEVRPPRQLDDAIPNELERICLKALSKRASERYTTAKDLADDLSHYLGTVPQAPEHIPPPAVRLAGKHAINETRILNETPVVSSASDSKPVKIVPKGLRSFDSHDADFFLALLPGPRDRDGLPDCIRFWKTWIEESHSDNTFSIGLIYGPSGCGKSSMVKAGLLPRLAKSIKVVYIEATGNETEGRLLKGLRRQIAELPSNLKLVESLAALRRGRFLKPGQKVLVVLDQFEQWLHTKKDGQNSELVQALRHCDGNRVQCIVMIRDDFWLAVSRFMKTLEVDILEGHNSALVDLFDLLHAHKVLAAFGRAYDRLPEKYSEYSKDQNDFLDRAIAGLSQDGKVTSVRLSLFAEMVKGKPWVPATLKEVGGTEGIGVTFLEETFTATTAPPQHRLHRTAAQEVLKALLPEAGTDIKGHTRTQEALLNVSGYASRPRDFDSLIHILDGEIRLITPADPESQEQSSTPSPRTGEKHYQLTHDYLVHSLRDWLNRKQKETRRGRAELMLADRATVWNARPENRQLPSLLEWLEIQRHTPAKIWTAPQQTMMQKAGRYHVMRGLVVALLLIATGIAGFAIQKQAHERDNASYAAQLVRRVFDVDVSHVLPIVNEMRDYRKWTDSLLLKEKTKYANDPGKLLHASLALLPVDAGQIGYLYDRLFTAEPQEMFVIREALIDHKSDLTERLWTFLANPKNDQNKRLRAACALALFDPDDARWDVFSGDTAATLVVQKPFLIAQWTDALKGVGRRLIPRLADFLVDEKRTPSERGSIASIYGEFAVAVPDGLDRLEKSLTQTVGQNANNDVKIDFAKQQASIASALLVIGHGENVWPKWKHSPDPTMRSFLIELPGSYGVDPKSLMDQLDKQKDVSVKRAILLSLGEFRFDRLSIDQRSPFLLQPLHFYRDDPDPGIHGAAEFLLRKWGAADQFKAIDEELATGQLLGQRRWYLNQQGQAMVMIPKSEEFWMRHGEKRRRSRIDRNFAIASKEVTVKEFLQFRSDQQYNKDLTPSDDCPINGVTWYNAAEYCNWLSQRERIPEDQWVYQPNDRGLYDDGMKIKENSLELTGYRLPTESEWEFACRAGADTAYGFGDSEELLVKYAWFIENSLGLCHPVALLKPNDLGLYDMHGNILEWCQDIFEVYDDGIVKKNLQVNDKDECVLRGGCFNYPTWYVRSAIPNKSDPPNNAGRHGIRLARTLPSISDSLLRPAP